MNSFKCYQPNKKDLKDSYGDCVIRALSKALDKTWLEVFDDLVPIARKFQCLINAQAVYEEYIKQQGFKYVGVSNKKGSKRPTVSSFTKANKKGIYLLRTAHHLVASAYGIYYDTWDSGAKSLYGYWAKEEF